MYVQRLAAPTNDLARRRLDRKIGPGQRGAVKLARMRGDAVPCVCHHENEGGTEWLTTVKLLVERAVIQKRDEAVAAFKIKPEELELRRLAQAKGASYDVKKFISKLARSQMLRMGRKARIAFRSMDFHQEHVPARQHSSLPVAT